VAPEFPSTPAALTSLTRGAVSSSLQARAEAIEGVRRRATRAIGIGVGVGSAGAVVAFALMVDVPGALASVVLLALTLGLSSSMLSLALASCAVELGARAVFRRIARAHGLTRDEADHLIELTRADLVEAGDDDDADDVAEVPA